MEKRENFVDKRLRLWTTLAFGSGMLLIFLAWLLFFVFFVELVKGTLRQSLAVNVFALILVVLLPLIAGTLLMITGSQLKAKRQAYLATASAEHVQPSNYQSPWRLFTLLFFAKRLYQLVWFYRSWKQLGIHHNLRIRAGLRTLGLFIPFLNIYLAYDLFSRININLNEARVRTFSLFICTTAFLSLSCLPYTLPGLLLATGNISLNREIILVNGAVALISITGNALVLVFIQRRLNSFWRQQQPGMPEIKKFTHGERILLGVFIPLTLIIFLVSFAPFTRTGDLGDAVLRNSTKVVQPSAVGPLIVDPSDGATTPVNQTVVGGSTITFQWNYPQYYVDKFGQTWTASTAGFVVATDPGHWNEPSQQDYIVFDQKVYSSGTDLGLVSSQYLPGSLADGVYYWRVFVLYKCGGACGGKDDDPYLSLKWSGPATLHVNSHDHVF